MIMHRPRSSTAGQLCSSLTTCLGQLSSCFRVQPSDSVALGQGKLPFDGFFRVLARRSSSDMADDQMPHRMAKMAMSLAALDELGRQGMEPVQDDQVLV